MQADEFSGKVFKRGNQMKKILLIFCVVFLSGCITTEYAAVRNPSYAYTKINGVLVIAPF
jgi:hypothetical protein